MRTKGVLYIAGPFRAPNTWEAEQNIRRAEELALRLWRKGYAVLCPHTNTRFFHGAATDAVWLNGDLDLLSRCDKVVVLPNWKRSMGAVGEVDFAIANNIPVVTEEELYGG